MAKLNLKTKISKPKVKSKKDIKKKILKPKPESASIKSKKKRAVQNIFHQKDIPKKEASKKFKNTIVNGKNVKPKPKLKNSNNGLHLMKQNKGKSSYNGYVLEENPTKDIQEDNDIGKPFWDDEEMKDLDDGNSDNFDNEIESHKTNLENLKTIDPEFYNFLQENDRKLLEFNVSDSENDEKEEQVHVPTGELEVASDESDFEGDDEEGKSGSQQLLTLRTLKAWQSTLKTDKTNKTISCLINAFHAALLRVSNEEEEVGQYKVDGSSVFNAVIQLCVLELSPAIRKFLGLTSSSKMQPHKCKKFVKVKLLLSNYFTDLLKLLGGVTSTNILTVLLKHLHHMSPLLASFPKIMKPLIKKLIYLWGTGEEVVRILSFLCILRITNNQSSSLLDTVLKSMYMTYIINSKFVSVNSLSSINFMRRSLAEMFALDPAVSYQHIFLYIRQLAIHLRNAIMVHKKENIQTVYNWQFINSLKLWGNVLTITHDKSHLQPLVYPFIQVCLGTIKLIPTAQYYPLRFHIVQLLIDFSRDTGIFIPVLPFILEVLNDYDFNKKHKKASMKPLNFTCLLRASNSQMSENGFKDGLIEDTYGLLLEYLAFQSHSIAFPDLSLFCIFQIKQFLKTCNVANYNKKMKQILEKIVQNNDFIEKERKNITFKITEYDKIKAWEITVKNKGTPLETYYNNWNKLKTIKKKKEVTNNDKLGDYNLPTIKRIKKEKKKDDKPSNPFPSDSESEDNFNFGGEIESNSEPKQKKKRNHKKPFGNISVNALNLDDEGQQDELKDFDITEW